MRQGWFTRAVDFLERHPAMRLLTLVATLVGLATAVAGVLVLGRESEPPAGARERDATDRVLACQRQHGMKRAVEWRETDAGAARSVIASCSWPPRPWTEPDGYGELAFSQRAGPGDIEASGATVEDHLRQPECGRFGFTYEVTQTGENALRKNEARSGSVVTPYGDTPALEGPTRPFPDEVIVQHTLGEHLYAARCVG